MTTDMNFFDPQAHPSEPPGYGDAHINGFSPLNIRWWYSLSPSSLPSSLAAYAASVPSVAINLCGFPFAASHHIGSTAVHTIHWALTKRHSLSPPAANHPRVMLASTSAHLGNTHCINCSTDLVNCLSAADVRKSIEESDGERERELEWYRLRRQGTQLQFQFLSPPLSLSGPTNLPSL